MSQAVEGPSSSLWPALWKLMRLRVLILASGFRRASRRGKITTAFLALLLVSFLVLVYVLSLGLLRFLRSPQLAAAVPEMGGFLASVPVLVVEAGFLVTLLTSFGVLLQALYLAGDMDFLLSAPVPIRAVFASKLLQAILPNLALYSLVALPVLYGLGASAGYNLLYYVLVPVMLVALALAAAGLASLVVMAVVRIFPARRVAEVLGFTGALVSLICSQSGQFARGSRVSAGQAATALRLAARFDVAWSPLAWAGRGLVGIAEGRWLSGVGYTLLALVAASLAFGLALTTAERLYYSGWAATRAVAHRKRAPHPPRRAAAAPLADLGARYLPPAVGAIVVKDWTMLRRDLRNLSQLVTPLVLGVVYAVMLFRTGGMAPPGRGEARTWFLQVLQGVMAYGGVAISLLAGWVLLLQLATMGFSQEG
jgi:ABC-2 type transport system permease protein